MSDSDAAQIQHRLTTLEVQVIERWAAHDKRSDERWADLMEQFHSMEKKFEARPCDEHMKVMSEFHGRVRAVEKWQDAATWAIGIVYAAIIGAIAKLFVR
jgi:DNA-binding GntR family transcriptional regulator